jgi:hypothetical protein
MPNDVIPLALGPTLLESTAHGAWLRTAVCLLSGINDHPVFYGDKRSLSG